MKADEDILTRFARIIAAEGYDRGLQPVQWQALRYLCSANRFSRTATALTAWLGQTKGSVSQTITALEKKGLVTRRTDEEDQRVVRLDLTEPARALVSAPPASVVTTMLDQLPREEREQFTDMVTRMLIGTLAHRKGRPFGECRTCRYFEPAARVGGAHRCAALDVALSDEDSAQVCFEHVAA